MNTEHAGNVGEESVRAILRELRGSVMSGFIRSNNLKLDGQSFQIDFLVLVPSIGLVNIEVKNWKGTVKATSSKKWQQEINTADKHYVNEFNNASMQALRTSGLLMQTLERERLNNWPIRSLVVFTNENAKVLRAKNKLAPQTDIILKHMLPNWFKDNARKDMTFNFSRGEFNQIKSCLVEHTQPYAA
ncbi:MAG: hypothetical protein CML20_07260 [Rheinheimera sp.]|nr:hypothetical protein [Rheinheimera sp.]